MVNKVQLESSGATDVGQMRSTNQDAFLIDEPQSLYIVADGMGGHAGGEIASKLCVDEIAQYARDNQAVFAGERKHPDPKVAGTLVEAVNYASTKIYERALEEPSLKGMGTTATVLMVVEDYAYCAHVGDSRLYLLRCGYIYQLTNDHSLVSEQVRAGLLTKEEAELHHLRNVITRSVGYQEEEDVDTTSLRLEDGDCLLICSDGLHGKVTDQELSLMIEKHGLKAVEELIKLANDRGGDDNITTVILKVKVSAK